VFPLLTTETESKFKLNQIYFYLTEGCNLACRHCWIAPKFESGKPAYPYVSLELFKSIIEQAKPLGLNAIKLTGGEPLLHPQIKELLDYIKEEDLRLVVETNGVLCTLELAEKMKACKNTFVSVSLDGATAQSHEWVRGVAGSLEAALEGARNLVKVGFRPQIIMSVMRHNRHEMETVVRMAEALGAGSVKFNLVQPTARGEKMHELGETLTIEELVDTGHWVETSLKPSSKLRIVYSHPPAFVPLGRILGDQADGCGTCGIFGIIGVLGNGKYALCGIGETVPELIFGDARTDRLKDVWENNTILNQIRAGLPKRLEGLCGDCIMKNRCLGNCIAQNYYRSKNLWATYWYCEEAHKLGKFPKSRLAKVSV
jgi:SynChlorMet cassette radical SAM/SPASM protein ScmF